MMRLTCVLISAFASLLVGVVPPKAQPRVLDPLAQANRVLDIFEAEGAKAFADALAEATANSEVSGLQAYLTPFERRRAKFRAVAVDRNYGGAIRQIVIYQYMLNEQHPFLYFRFIYKMTDEGWRLTNFAFDAETGQPFPPKYNIN
jgi:hypothetical protein